MKRKTILEFLKTVDASGTKIEFQGIRKLQGGLSLKSKLDFNLPNTGCINQNCTNSPAVCGNPANCAVC